MAMRAPVHVRPLLTGLAALALLGGGATGASGAGSADDIAAPAADSCEGRPVLMVVDGHTIDPARMRAYTEKLLSSGLYAALGGYYINSPRPIASFEGQTVANHATLIVRFPCLANARAFWYSRAYQETIRPLRLDPLAGDFTVRVFRETDPPVYMAGKVEPGRYRSSFPAEIETVPLPPEAAAAAQPAPTFRRTTLVVASLDRALKLYRDVLGFAASPPRQIARDGSAGMIFNLPVGELARFVTLDAGGLQREIVGLIEVPSYRARRVGVRATALVIKVPVPLESILPKIAATGATLMPPTMAGSNKEQGLLDADGNLVVLYETAR
jgi:uncharacterized protein (DUF1330 family)/catechol 2,3-dioxygenase-like lactoylglutathione lyase family enzyme